MLRTLRKALAGWRRNERGNAFMLGGATLLPLLLIMGGAVDLHRFARYKANLSNGIDAAALALARRGETYTEAQAKTFVEEYIAALQIDDSQFTLQEITVNKTTKGYIVNAHGTMTTMFLPLGHLTSSSAGAVMEMGMDIVAEVVHSSNRLELAMVLDVTGSMNCGDTVSSSCTGNWSNPGSSSRIVALRDAATDLVDILMTDAISDPDMIKIGVVPFEGTVNIGATYAATPPWWVDWNIVAQAYWNGRNFTTPTGFAVGTRPGHRWLFEQLAQAEPSIAWAGCVEMRAAPYDILDTTPNTGSPDTLFVPFFWPDEPDRYSTSSTAAPYQYTTSPISTRYNSNHSSSNPTSTSSSYNYPYHNNYLADRTSPSAGSSRPATAQSYADKYRYVSASDHARWHTSPSSSNQFTAATSFPYSAGPNRGCPQAMLALTNDKTAITGLLGNLIAYPAMGTFIPNGLVWGWHMLTPTEPLTQGVAPEDEHYDNTVKAIVLLTDGDNSVTGASNHNNSYFNGYNYVTQGRLGTTSSASTATDNLNTKTATLCTNIKTDGIRVYTITFGTISSATLDLMEDCATVDKGEPLHYHAPTPADLEDIFVQIGEDLSEIHLAM
jgi:Flp pilus assembly protein TadG